MDHSELAHFVGSPANTKDYRIALSSGKVVIASDVSFVESKPPSGDPAPAPKDPAGTDRLQHILEEVETHGQAEPADTDDPGDEQDPDNAGAGEDDQADQANPGPAQDAQDQGAGAARTYPARPRTSPGSWRRLQPETAAAAVLEEPTTYEEIMSSEQAEECRQAMDDEIKSLLVNQT